jgi:hypothetical protein
MCNRISAIIWGATVLGKTSFFAGSYKCKACDSPNSRTVIAAIQAATAMPIFLFAGRAELLLNILHCRCFLVAIQLLLGAVSVALRILAAEAIGNRSQTVSSQFSCERHGDIENVAPAFFTWPQNAAEFS